MTRASSAPSPRTGSRWVASLASLTVVALTSGIALTTSTATAAAPRSPTKTRTVVVARIAAGGPVRDVSGKRWVSDKAYAHGGTVKRFKTNVLGTRNDAIYQGERYGGFTYQIPVPSAGVYHVQINEAEFTFSKPKQRVFSVKAEGVTKLSNVDIVKRAKGKFKPVTLAFNVRVKDGSLTLEFHATKNHGRISSVLVSHTVTTTKGHAPTAGASKPVQTTPKPSPTTPTSSPTTPAAPNPATSTTSGSIYGSPLVGDPTAPLAGFFGPESVFKMSLTGAPVAGNSAAMIANLNAQVQAYYSGIAGFNVWQYNSSDYTVGAGQARVTLKWDDCQHKGYVPSSLYGPNGFMVDVPIPSNAVPSVGSDASIGIYQPSSDTFWGFWKLNKQADGWHACWGGKITQVSQSRGWYPDGGGVSATGLADGGAIGVKEAQLGQIDHAIAIGIPSPADSHRFSWPALRSDGSDYSTDAIPEGTRLRLDPTIDVDSLKLNPLAKMVAKAAQKYGLIVTDKAGCVSVSTESGAATQNATGTNPWTALLGGTPSYLVMKNFPWDKLQAMPQDYGKS